MNDYIIFETDEELLDEEELVYQKIFLLSINNAGSLVKIKHNIKNMGTIISLNAFSKGSNNVGTVYISETKIGIKIKKPEHIYIVVRYTK